MNVCDVSPVSYSAAKHSYEQSTPNRVSCDWAPGKTLAQLRRQMEYLEEVLCNEGNCHAFFLSSYIVSMKKCEFLIQAIRDSNHPQHHKYNGLDADLVEAIASHFSRLYFSAYGSYRNGRTIDIPEPWKITFQLSEKPDASPALGILLGLIAHSCFDLPLVLSTKLDSGKTIYERSNKQHQQTYRRISRLLVDELKTIAKNLAQTKNAIQPYLARKSICIFPIFLQLLGKLPVSYLIYRVLHCVHREALLNSIRLQRSQITVEELSSINSQHIRMISRGPLSLKILRYFIQILVR